MMQFERDPPGGDIIILRADDGLNEDTGDLVGQLEKQLDQGRRMFIVDGANIRYISSKGMSALVRLHHRIRMRGGEMALAAFNPLPTQALQMTRLDRVFGLHETIDQARDALRHA
jgi:anti-anti-sigma factor